MMLAVGVREMELADLYDRRQAVASVDGLGLQAKTSSPRLPSSMLPTASLVYCSFP